MLELQTSVQYVKGIGPRIAAILAEKGIVTVEDLLFYLPFRYEDRVNPRSIAQLRAGEMASVIAEVRTSGLFRTSRSHMPLFQMTVGDPSALMSSAGRSGPRGRASIKCLWFNATYLKDKFRPGQLLALYGKVEFDEYGGGLQMVQPQFEMLTYDDDETDAEAAAAESLEIGRIVPIYESAGHGKLTARWFRRVIHRALEDLAPQIPDGVPPAVRQRMGLMPRRQAFWQVHWPDAGARFDDLQNARTPAHLRLIFEELFFLELGLELKRRQVKAQPGIAFAISDRARQAIKTILPFHPTTAQKRVLKEIADDMRRPAPMRRLLQGDVGSGKTIVAFEAAIIAIENGYQVALMAPTEILAVQHYLSARRILNPRAQDPSASLRSASGRAPGAPEKAGYRIVLLTGSVGQERKREVRRHISTGDAQLVIGTHALIQETVEFARLGLVIVDEQHRFGVMQRFKLMKKPAEGAALEPDTLVMTATPIPRTLALTLYGDLDVSIIDEMPPGRTPIVTRRVTDDKAAQVWDFVRKQVKAGRQTYVVYPVIEEQPDDELAPTSAKGGAPASSPPARQGGAKTRRPKQPSLWSGLKAAVQMYNRLRTEIFPGLRVGLLHGRLPAEEKEAVMQRFQAGEIDVLVSTTVIEVGVDVANASVMVVEHADRFGLSQLHQLRGRIGRGAAKSYCVLMTAGRVTTEASQRLDAMVRTTNGFELAELDLQLRGPGEFFGTRQAGLPDFRVSNLVRDREILQAAKREAAIVAAGPSSEIPAEDMSRVLVHLRSHWQRKYALVEVG